MPTPPNIPGPPSGTVTFLFTDIEGSTRRWEQQPEEMQRALARHDSILRRAIESSGGYVFKTVGDAFYAAFHSPIAALEAALQAQRALRALQADDGQRHDGPGLSLRVRMALHTGVAELRDADYFGQPLNRVARLLSAGHGGQVLLSLATEELVRDRLPPGVELRDMGERRLKDLQRPERIFQVVAPDLPGDFPPLKTLDARPNNLPAETTPFVGRERELQAAAALLRRPDVRLVTFTGPGGTGKTRLALQVAADLADEFKDGIFLVSLASIREPDFVGSAIAQTLDLDQEEGRSLIASLKRYLHDREMLLLLDNFEQVVDAAPLVGELLSAAPRLKVLVTSRAALRVYGEHEFPVPPLQLPDIEALPPLDALVRYEAIALFVQRAELVKPDFALTAENAAAVATICHRLDGLPLAIELAAARVRLLAPQAMLPRLERRLRLLTGGARNLPARQQTLRGAIEWSYDLLSDEEKKLFRRLSVFVEGQPLEAIEAVVSPGVGSRESGIGVRMPQDIPPPASRLPTPPEIDILDGMESLRDKSLVVQEMGVGGEPRFRMLETIREYAAERLEESGEAEELRQRHAAYFLALAQEAESTGAHARALSSAALVAMTEGNESEARSLYHRSLALYRKLGGKVGMEGEAAALVRLGHLAYLDGDYAEARSRYEEALPIYRALGDMRGVEITLYDLGTVAREEGDLARARSLFEESLAMAREHGSMHGITWTLNDLGEVVRALGDHAAARRVYEESLAISRRLDAKGGVAMALHHLADLAQQEGAFQRAASLLAGSLQILRELEHKRGIAIALPGVVGLAQAMGQPERAARLSGAADALLDTIEAELDAADRAEYDRSVAAARSELGEERFEAAHAEGMGMSIEEAIAYATEMVGEDAG